MNMGTEGIRVKAARWIVGKALAPVMEGMLEAWATSRKLGLNMVDLKMELLYAQAMLDKADGSEICSPALKELLLMLQQLAYSADDALDELDYFRIQDELEGTFEAAAKDPRGDIYGAALHARQVGVKLQETASDTGHTVGKFLLSNLMTLTSVEPGDVDSTITTPPASGPGQTDAGDPGLGDSPSSKLEFLRVKMSGRMKSIVNELKPLCAKVSDILKMELLDSSRSISQMIVAELRAVHLREQGSIPILLKNDVKARPKTTSDTSEPNFCGRGVETAKIMNIIRGDDILVKDMVVLPIVGLGGMGKTTLAQHIYEKAEGRYFDVRIWACVSTDFSVPRLFKDIVESKSLSEFKDEVKDGATPEEQIEDILANRKFFLVLDDIWDTIDNDGWDRLLAPFKKCKKKGSMVLVTSRYPLVAQIVKTTDNTIDLEGLGEVEFQQFFWSCVFGDDNKSKEGHDELVKIGKDIMKKLKGCPLAAETVGRLLRNNLDETHWIKVRDSKEWELQAGENDIMPALKLSYDFLPFHLQRCFSYCTLFPQDYRFSSQELIHWWIGLDFLQPGSQNRSIEDIGQTYLEDLVNYGFIKKQTFSGSPRYIMHDLLHDLGLKVASRECLSVNSSNVLTVEIWPSVRHLSIIIDDTDDYGKMVDFINGLRELLLEGSLKTENLQTLMVFGLLDENFTGLLRDLIRKASGLRVLSLNKMNSHMEFPILYHLRYLRLGCNNTNLDLPSMLSRLYHLRILDLLGWHGKLDLLRAMSNLTKLSHFDSQDKLHSEICNVGELQALQELNRFEVNKECTGFELKQLGKITKIRKLRIHNLEKINTKEEAGEAKLVDKKWLQRLELNWSGDEVATNERNVQGLVLEGLQPPRNLQELYIGGHLSHSWPTWLGRKYSLRTLHSLHLHSVHWEFLPSLGHMDLLRDLKLNMPKLKEFDPGHFAGIKRLELHGLNGLEKWVPGDNFSQLQELVITNCPPLVWSVIQPTSRYLWSLQTNDITSALDEPICNILSSSLTRLIVHAKSWNSGVKRLTENQESALVLLKSLQYLEFGLNQLECLPAGLHRLGKLKELEIKRCRRIKSLPKDGLPSSLQELHTSACPIQNRKLRQACRNYIRDHPEMKLRF